MLIREYTESDLARLTQIHSVQGFDYAFPDLENPLFVSKLVLQDTDGQLAMAAFAHLTCEIYLLADPKSGTPRSRYANLLALHQVARQDLHRRGLEDAHAWLPPRIANRFGKRLLELGWARDDSWTPYSIRF